MSTIDRMLKERDRLLSEAQKIDDAVNLLRKFQNDAAPVFKKAKTRQSRNSGMMLALRDSFKDAVIKHGRPVTREEILEFVPKRGFSINDISKKQFANCAYLHFPGERIQGKRNGTYWFKDQPRPEKEEWKKELEKLK